MKSPSIFPQEGSIRKKIFLMFDSPQSSAISMVVAVTVMLLIFLSIVSFVIETLPQYKYPQYGDKPGDSPPAFRVIEVISILAFTLEYTARLVCSPAMTWEG